MEVGVGIIFPISTKNISVSSRKPPGDAHRCLHQGDEDRAERLHLRSRPLRLPARPHHPRHRLRRRHHVLADVHQPQPLQVRKLETKTR